MATGPVSNGAPIIPNEKGFFSHSMHSTASKYGHISDGLWRRGSILLCSTIGSDTKFWMRNPAGGIETNSFAEINSGVKKNTDFTDYRPKNVTAGTTWLQGFTSSGFNPSVITHQPSATERNRMWTASYLYADLIPGDAVILHNSTPPGIGNFGETLNAYLYQNKTPYYFSGSNFVYTSGVVALQLYNEDLYATASFVSGSVDEGHWPAARLMHVSYSLEPLVWPHPDAGTNWMMTTSEGPAVSPYYAPYGTHSTGKMLEYAINHYSEHLITTFSSATNEMHISSSVTEGDAYRINNLCVIDIHVSKSLGNPNIHDTMFDPWELESSASTIGWGYREAQNGMLLPNSDTVTSGSSFTCFDWMWYYERVWGRNSTVELDTCWVATSQLNPNPTTLPNTGPFIDYNTVLYQGPGGPGYIWSSGSDAWRIKGLETLNLTSSSPADSYWIYTQSLSMSFGNPQADKVTYPLSFNVWPHTQSNQAIFSAVDIPGTRHTESLSEGKTLLTYLTFADGQPRHVKKSNCECTELVEWINYPQFGDYDSSRTERYRLTFSDGYSFTAGSLLRLFSYNPLYASATTSYAGIPSPNNSGNWPHSMTTRTPIEIYNDSASFEFAPDVAFVKCNDLDPGTTSTTGMVYLTNIHRIGDAYNPNSISSSTEYNWTYESDYHFSINKHSYDGTTYNEYNTTASYHPHMTRVNTARDDRWGDLLSGWLMLENGLYVGFEACNETDNGCSVGGCMDPVALNYDPMALWQPNADSCIYCTFGCMDDGTDPSFPGRPVGYPLLTPALNYNGAAGPYINPCNTGCTYCVYGCTDVSATNYNAAATCDDHSCVYCIDGCMTATSSNYNPLATCDDGSCYDCIDFTASVVIQYEACKDDGDAAITASAVGGLLPYTFSWYANPPVSVLSTNPILGGLTAGDVRWVLVRDNNGCADAVLSGPLPVVGSCAIDSVTIHMRPPTGADGAFGCGVTYAMRNGGVSASVVGGTPPYKYSWYTKNGQHNDHPGGCASGLGNGNYSLACCGSGSFFGGGCAYDCWPGWNSSSASIPDGIQQNNNLGCAGTQPTCIGWNWWKVVVEDSNGYTAYAEQTMSTPINDTGCTTSSFANYSFAYNINGTCI